MTPLKTRVGTLLRKSERYTKTDMVYVFSGSFWLGLGQVISLVGTFVLGIAFAHFLSKDMYGTYKYILSIGAIINSLALAGLSTTVLRSSSAGRGSVLPESFRQYLLYGSAITLAGLAISAYYFLHGNAVLSIGIFAAAMLLPLIGAASLFDSYLQGTGRFRVSALFSIITTVVPTVVLLALLFSRQGVLALALGYFIATAVVTVLAYIYVMRRFRVPSQSPHGEDDRSFGLHLSAMSVLTSISAQIDQIFLFQAIGPAALAVYAFAIAVPEQSKGFIKNISNLALAKFTHSAPSRSSITHKTLALAGLIAIPVCIYIFMAPILFSLFFPAYLSSVPYSQAFAVSLIFVSSILPQAHLQAALKTRALYHITVLSVIVQTGAMIGLGLAFGIWGVIAGRVIGRGATWLATLYAARITTV